MKTEKNNGKLALSKEARQWYQDLQKAYGISDEAGLLLLQSGMEAFDRMREAQAQIKEHGVCFLDRYGQLKPNPACAVERDARSQLLACLKVLNLELQSYEEKT